MQWKNTSVGSHFDGHADALEQCTWHHPIQQIQGHTRCPWTLALDNYYLRITPAATRATKKNNQQMTLKRWLNWWPWQCAGTLPHTSSNGGGLGLSKIPLNATIGQVLWPIMTIGHACDSFFDVFIIKTIEKGRRSMLRPLFLIGVLHINLEEP